MVLMSLIPLTALCVTTTRQMLKGTVMLIIIFCHIFNVTCQVLTVNVAEDSNNEINLCKS